MALRTSGNTPPNIRHRIQEITIQPTTSEHPTRLEVLIDGRSVHKLSTIKPSQILRWDLQTYPCDVHSGSTIGLRFIEKHQLSPDREVLTEYTISNTVNQTSITKDAGAFPSGLSALGLSSKRPNVASAAKSLAVTVKFVDLSQVRNNYSATLVRATRMVEEANGPLDRLGNSRDVLKTILGFGAVVAELHPTAKLVIGLCTKAWEYLEKLQKQHEDLQRLIDGLMQMQPFIDSVGSRAKEAALENVILSLLLLIEDTCNYIINSMHQTNTGRVMHGFSDTKESYRINELLQKFGDLKEQFDRGVGVQVLNQVLSSEQRALINRLELTTSSLKFMPTPCQEGTRVQAITDICAWHEDTSNPQKLLWLYGQAGMGKSSIAASICQVFHDAGTLGAHFFFRRDDPYLRNPDHMLNIIVHRLAFRYEPYGRAVASAIENYSGLLDMPLGQRYIHLVERPLQNLVSSSESPLVTFAIVVDALDECEHIDSRRPLFIYLREISRLVPWIKIVVTSRPDEDIETVFDTTNYSWVISRSIASYDASSDILKYTHTRMTGIASRKRQLQWPEDSVQELSARAAGLFIWVETACKFIERGADTRRRLEQVLTGTQPAEGSAPLDLLYTTAIIQGMGDEGSDNLEIFRECIGAIVATGTRTPLSVAGLELLLSGRVSPGVFQIVISGLGSVLYEDASQKGAVRVYHPSFADFILDASRSGNMYSEPSQQNTMLAECSLGTMIGELRFNICGLETSHIPNLEVVGLKARVETAIKPHVVYSCLHWSSHLIEAPSGTLQDQLEEFLYGPQLLYWIEAMSLLEQTSTALSCLLELIKWASATMQVHSSYASDAYRFILTFYDAISQSTPHLYISALPFSPTNSKLAQRMRPLFPNALMAALNMNEGWPAWLQSIPHGNVVESIACSANGRRIVSGCEDGTVQIWDSITGAAISEPLSSPYVLCVAISANGQRVASGSFSGTLQVWDGETGVALGDPLQHHGGSLLSLALSSDGSKLFSTGSRGNVLVWDTNARGKTSTPFLHHSDSAKAAAVSPDERRAVFCYNDGTIRVWDVGTGTPLTEPIQSHSVSVRCVAFSPNCQAIAIGSDDAKVRILEVSPGRALQPPMTGHSDHISSIAFSPDGQYVVSGSNDMTVRVWDVGTGMPACSPLLGHTSAVTSVGFCSNNRRVVSASYDKTVLIWDVGTDITTSKPMVGHTSAVNSVAFSSDGCYIASGSADGTICVWDVKSGDEAFRSLPSHSGINLVGFLLNSLHIVSLAWDKMLKIHDVKTGALETHYTLSYPEEIISTALSSDGQSLASYYEDGRMGVWDTKTGVAEFVPTVTDSGSVYIVVLSPDGRFVASGSEGGIVRIWEADNSTAIGDPLVGRSDWALAVCFSPDSRRIASGFSDGTVQVWDTETGFELFKLPPGHESPVRSITFTLDGRYIISGSDDATLRIWDTETGAAVAEPLKGHLHAVNSIASSPNGRRIVTGGEDTTVRIWDMENLHTRDQLVIDELFAAPLNQSISTSVLAHYINKGGWVTSSTGALLLWLPKRFQREDDSVVQISITPTPNHILLDFSRFVHGNSWASVAGG